MIRFGIVAVVALMISATTALALQEEEPVFIAIDADASGNTPASLASIDNCRSVQPNDTFDVDLVVQHLPPLTESTGGLGGFSYNLLYDGSVLELLAADNNFLVASDGGADAFEIMDGDGSETSPDPLPSRSGNFRTDFVDLSGRAEDSDGVLTRLTFRAVGEGTSSLRIENTFEHTDLPIIFGREGAQYEVPAIGFADISVGAPCAGGPTPHPISGQPFTTARPDDGGTIVPTPIDSGGPAQTPDPAATPSPAPSGSAPAPGLVVSIDAIPSGNSPRTLGTADACASADVGDEFIVDVTGEELIDLIAWSAPISYDPDVLRIDASNVKMFLAGNQGSQVLDFSAQTPDESGRYVAGAAEASDPPRPDSGNGTLVRLSVTAIGEGTSPLSLAPVDVNDDGTPDNGVFLRNGNNQVLGDTNGDTFFDGLTTDAEIRVGSECPDPDAKVVADAGEPATPAPDETGFPHTGGDGDDGGSDALLYLAIGLVAILAAAGVAAGYYFMRGRRGAAP